MAPTSTGRGYSLNPALWALAISGLLLQAGDPSWKDKPIASWSREDAEQVLTNSPWAKTATAGIGRGQSEADREAGVAGARGVGYDGVEDKRPKPQLPKSIPDFLKGSSNAPPPAQFLKLQLRWESALPVRAAELKSGVIEPPTLANDGYSIAVYGVPGAYFKGDPKSLGDPLKKQAALKRDGKKDVRPSSVEVFQRDDGLVIVYTFPLSADLAQKDGHVDFEAQIGRLTFTQTFQLDEMQYQGKPAL